MESTDYTMPPAIRAGLEAHRDERLPNGSFVTAVLENDLMGAVGHADKQSMAALRDIVMWCYWELPSAAWGSKGKVVTWLYNGDSAVLFSQEDTPEDEECLGTCRLRRGVGR